MDIQFLPLAPFHFIVPMSKSFWTVKVFRGVFKTLSNIYDEAFLRKYLIVKVVHCFRGNDSIIGVRKGPKYVFVRRSF